MKNILFLLLITTGISAYGQTQPTQIKGDFALKNVHTGKYVRIKDANGADGTPIVAYPGENWKCMTWQFKPSASSGYVLKNLLSGKTLQPKGELKAGTTLEEQPLNGQQQPEYELIATEKGKYRIRLKGTNLYITPSSADGTTNSSIILQPEQIGDLQEWTLVEQHPTI